MNKVTQLGGLLILLCLAGLPARGGETPAAKITGACFVSPRHELQTNPFGSYTAVNARWAAIIPYALCRPGQTSVTTDHPRQWWGEGTAGTRVLIGYARQRGLKVMLKPHIWVRGQGWPGDFELPSAGAWEAWESEYEAYILPLAALADSLGVEIFCMGTEIRHSAADRPAFWRGLIRKIKKVYKGKVTYAANWDNFEKVSFWDLLDYIGIDAYFPLLEDEMPTVEDLTSAWGRHLPAITKIQESFGKPVLFTEYGYRSIDGCTGQTWHLTRGEMAVRVNLQAQADAYRALYRVFWDKPWFAGGFLWKWFADHEHAGGASHAGHTPQNKPAMAVIRHWYGGAENRVYVK